MLRLLTRNGLRRGLLGGSRVWTIVFVTVGGLRLLSRLAGRDEKVVFREELAPGTSLVISHGTEEEPEVRPAVR